MLDKEGREVLNTDPVEWPLGLRKPLSIQDEIKRFVRAELSQRAAEHGMESFEEADDFDVEDDDEFVSPYEMTEMQEEAPARSRSVGSDIEPVAAAVQQKPEAASPVPPAEQPLEVKKSTPP